MYKFFTDKLDDVHIIESEDVKFDLIKKYQDTKDNKSFERLLDSYLKMIVKNAGRIHSKYRSIDLNDLIQNAIIGFERALRKVNTSLKGKNINLDSYIMRWSDEYMYEFIRNNHKVVRLPKAKTHEINFINNLSKKYDGNISQAIEEISNGNVKKQKKLETLLSYPISVSSLTVSNNDNDEQEQVIDPQIYTFTTDIDDNEISVDEETFSQILEKMGTILSEYEKTIVLKKTGMITGKKENCETIANEYNVSKSSISKTYINAIKKLKVLRNI